MRLHALQAAALLATLALAGCDGDPLTSERAADSPLLARNRGPSNPNAAFYLPAAQGSLRMWGDGAFTVDNPFPGTSRYKEAECGVRSTIFYTGSGDATMQTDNQPARKCSSFPRKVWIDLSYPVQGSGASPEGATRVDLFINVLDLQTTTSGIAWGEGSAPVMREIAISLKGSSVCDLLRFRPRLPSYGDVETGADRVEVTRLDARTWRVRTLDGADKAACLKNDVLAGLYHIPVDFHIVSDRDLTP